jgi:hypothetical protein
VGVLLGLGATYHLSRNVAVFVDVNEIATLPKFMALTEVNLGFTVAFGREKAAAPADDDGVISEKAAEASEEPPSEQ